MILEGPALPPGWSGELIRGCGWQSWTIVGRTRAGALVCVRGLADQRAAAARAWEAFEE